MNRYKKGADFEREVVAEFWNRGWGAIRSAGSGTVSHPVPDVIAARDGKILAIECKTTRNDRLSLKEAMLNLREFSQRAGCRAYLGIKFYREKPRFYELEGLLKKRNYTVNSKDGFLTFDSLVGEQERLL
ncbi:MAG: Holliday junction resolvase Hjc [Candidatus Altiarchaeota archaeon]